MEQAFNLGYVRGPQGQRGNRFFRYSEQIPTNITTYNPAAIIKDPSIEIMSGDIIISYHQNTVGNAALIDPSNNSAVYISNFKGPAGGTSAYFGTTFQNSVTFDSNPQTQLNNHQTQLNSQQTQINTCQAQLSNQQTQLNDKQAQLNNKASKTDDEIISGVKTFNDLIIFKNGFEIIEGNPPPNRVEVMANITGSSQSIVSTNGILTKSGWYEVELQGGAGGGGGGSGGSGGSGGNGGSGQYISEKFYLPFPLSNFEIYAGGGGGGGGGGGSGGGGGGGGGGAGGNSYIKITSKFGSIIDFLALAGSGGAGRTNFSNNGGGGGGVAGGGGAAGSRGYSGGAGSGGYGGGGYGGAGGDGGIVNYLGFGDNGQDSTAGGGGGGRGGQGGTSIFELTGGTFQNSMYYGNGMNGGGGSGGGGQGGGQDYTDESDLSSANGQNGQNGYARLWRLG